MSPVGLLIVIRLEVLNFFNIFELFAVQIIAAMEIGNERIVAILDRVVSISIFISSPFDSLNNRIKQISFSHNL